MDVRIDTDQTRVERLIPVLMNGSLLAIAGIIDGYRSTPYYTEPYINKAFEGRFSIPTGILPFNVKYRIIGKEAIGAYE
ncbi:MAG: hypothetical protein WAX69_14130 [Victivallales bacterium]